MILLEALFVAVTFCILSSIVHMFFMKVYGDTSMEHYSLIQQSFVSAFLFHIVFEFVGLNDFYCNYKK